MATDDKTTKPLTETFTTWRLLPVDPLYKTVEVFIGNGWEIRPYGNGLKITAPSGKRIDVLGMVMSEDRRELEVICK